jgi:hypothetical protein
MDFHSFKWFLGRAGLTFLHVSLICGGLTPSGACQQSDWTAPASASQSGYTLSGTVVNSLTGEPIGRAAVEMQGQITRMTLTDSTGHFEFDAIGEQRAYLTASKPGFSSNAVPVNRDLSPVLLKMSPTNTIFGRVTTGDRQPLEGFVVQAIGREVIDGRPTSSTAFQTPTDEDGDFRISGLPAATYYLVVNQQNQETTLSQAGIPNAREQTYSAVYYPGVAESSAAIPMELAFGREVEANFSLSPEPLYQVSGTVDAQPNAISGFTITRNNGEEPDFMQNISVTDGKFQTKLPAGSYTVNGFRADGVSLSASVTIRSDTPDLQLAMVPAPSIEVQVQTEHGAGSALQPVSSASYQPMGMIIQLISTSPFHPWSAWWDPQSNQALNLQPGTFRLRIVAPALWWVKSARCRGIDLLTDDLTIPAAGSTPPIEVTLQDGAGSVGGTVTASDGTLAVAAVLVQSHGDRNLIQEVTSADGSFSFPAVAPGDYALLAFRTADQIEYENPTVLKPYLADAAHISVQANAATNVSVGLRTVKR